MTYILMIWTVVGFAGSGQQYNSNSWKTERDWRPIGEFHNYSNDATALEKCEQAARQLGLKTEIYRCVRSK